MSEFHVRVIQVGKLEKHPHADTLSILDVEGYPVICKSEAFKEGQKAVYVPVDSLCPTDKEEFLFLRTENLRPFERIKAKKLRGVFSMGLLVPADPSWEVGQNVQELLGIKKYEPEVSISTGGECEKDPGIMPIYTDLEGLRKYKNLLIPGEEVILTEKIHGCLRFDSIISMANNRQKYITEVEVGDYVKSWNGEKVVSSKVVAYLVQEPTNQLKWLSLEFNNELSLVCTEDHLILTSEGWIEAGKLTESHEILDYTQQKT